MSTRLVSVDSLMLHDAVLIESDLSNLSERDWQSIAPSGHSLGTIKRNVQQGEYVVLSDTPRSPLFGLEDGKPTVSSAYCSGINAQTLALLNQRFQSAGSSAFYNTNNNGNLHPSPPLDYIADTSKVREGPSKLEPVIISDNFSKAPPKLELELCYDDREKTYASNVPYSVIFSDPGETVIKGVLNDMGWAMVEGGPNYPAKVMFGDEAEKAQAESTLKSQYQQLDQALNDTAKQVVQHTVEAKNKAKQQEHIEVTESFKAAVDSKVAELNAQSKAFDNLSYLSQTWELAKATKEGASNGFTEYLPDLGEFGELLEAADIDITMLIEAISTGNIDALEAKLQQWKARGNNGFKEARKTMETLILILSDPISREMLASVPKRILAALPEDQIAELSAYQATQMGMDTAVITGGTAVGTLAGGVGGSVAAGILFAATTARKGGKALEGTINIVSDISKSLKKINNHHEAKPYKKENVLPLETGDNGKHDKKKIAAAGLIRKDPKLDQHYKDVAAYEAAYQKKLENSIANGDSKRRQGAFKAKLTEAKGERAAAMYMEKHFATPPPPAQMELGFSPGPGVDQIWSKRDANGNVLEYFVVEAKGPGAKLQETSTKGMQMSNKWVKSNLNTMKKSQKYPQKNQLGSDLLDAIEDGDPKITKMVIEAVESDGVVTSGRLQPLLKG